MDRVPCGDNNRDDDQSAMMFFFRFFLLQSRFPLPSPVPFGVYSTAVGYIKPALPKSWNINSTPPYEEILG
jgi:hypothetical protein